jgi:hypothetical protein
MEQLQVPVPMPLRSILRQMLNHRDMESHQIFEDLLLLTGSGTGGREAAIVNVLSSMDKISSTSKV